MTGYLALAPLHNSEGRRDATGAFQPEAEAWLDAQGLTGAEAEAVLIDNRWTNLAMRRAVIRALECALPDVLGIFCHGWGTGIQFGFSIGHVDSLAEAIHVDGDVAPRVALYCCSTGKGPGVGGDGGFADMLRDALCRAGSVYCRVDAHTTAGHCTRNPYVRRFEGGGSASGGSGGAWIVTPASALWDRWRAALRDTDLRLRYPTMTVAEIHAELGQGR